MKSSTKLLLQKVSAFLGETMNGLHTEAQTLKNEIEEHLSTWDGFEITCVSREDLRSKGYDVDKIEDHEMERLASKMGDDYCEQLFWIQLPIIADGLDFPMTELGKEGFYEVTVDEAVEAWNDGCEVYAFDTRDGSDFLVETDHYDDEEENTEAFREKIQDLDRRDFKICLELETKRR